MSSLLRFFFDTLRTQIHTENLESLLENIMRKATDTFPVSSLRFLYNIGDELWEFSLTPQGFRRQSLQASPLSESSPTTAESNSVGAETVIPLRGENDYQRAYLVLSFEESTGEERKKEILEMLDVLFTTFLRLYESANLSIIDELTGLYNNRYLKAYLDQESERSLRYHDFFSVIFLDLDGLKAVNDNYGHIYGARTLKEMGALLRDYIRSSDVVGRFGGDEFIIVAFRVKKKQAKMIAERIRLRIKDHLFLQNLGLNLRLTASFGIASFPEDAQEMEDLINKADQAMYRVKKRGKDGVECYSEEDEKED